MDERAATPGGSAGITRRTVVAGVAWSIPVVILATATPALASSGETTVVVSGPGPSGAAEFQTLTLTFTNLPAIPAGDLDGSSTMFLELCMPEGLGVTAISSVPSATWLLNPPDYQGGGSFTWNLADIAAGSLQVFFTIRNDTGGPLAGRIEVDTFVQDAIGPIYQDVDFLFGSNAVGFVTCSG